MNSLNDCKGISRLEKQMGDAAQIKDSIVRWRGKSEA